MKELIRIIAADRELRKLMTGFVPGERDALITGLSASARHLYYSALQSLWSEQRPRGSLLIVTHSVSAAEMVWDDLRELLPEQSVFLYPEREVFAADAVAFSKEEIGARLRVLQHLASGQPAIVIATIASAIEPVLSRGLFRKSEITFELGAQIDLAQVTEQLIGMGYERVELVEAQAQFSLRGGILDIFPLGETHPFRIELFDTDIDSIRTFDLLTQRSIEKLKHVMVGPAIDFLVPPSVMMSAAAQLSVHLEERMKTVTEQELRTRLLETVGRDVEQLRSGTPFYGALRYVNLFSGHFDTLFSYGDTDMLVCLDEPSRLQERQKGLERDFTERISGALMKGNLISGTLDAPDFELVWDHPYKNGIEFSMFARAAGGHRYHTVINLTYKPMQQFHGQINVLKSEMKRWEKSETQVVFFAASPERAQHLERVLHDYRIEAERADTFVANARPQVLVANLSSGFELPMMKIAVIHETDVFSARKKTRRLRSEISDAERIKSYQDLKVGDYVVHANHGIGKYLGIRTLEIDGRHNDYLFLQYAGNDSLYVPTDQIDQVQRYIGSEEKEPKIHHLGSSDWARTKQKVSKSVRDIAEDLVKLYAARQATPGHAFGTDVPWQREFEAMFPYEETIDQLRAIQDIKRDMEQGRPMDRLLCGDVGYGKTEVAIRAAFKAVMDGKQVAVLVPTTVLAHQHGDTFKERFEGFPATVEVLSRFRSKAESDAIIRGLKDGSIDVVIGTHRLLQKSIQFKDLGLLIVDEEQRFGVTHKERLKQIRTNVDCLTLTATPIPRTLHMSLLGVRDLSVIETPPENRFPVQTYVVEFNEALIREALERELSRGGQVYFLFNQVNGIRSMVDRIARLVPDARIAPAHGQMQEHELERVMLDFLDGEIDILVTTTIIETGLDIPNVNTLIVYDSDRLGLSQLYQLRGRVGRSNRIAYAYFTYQRNKVLTEVAEKRLQAIKEFTELGSGFKIAMRDLSIRGAGNLLGAEQHGFINSVGFDMYNDMLHKAVNEIKGEQQISLPEPTIDLAIEAYLPDQFISDAAQKIAMYKKFKYVHSQELADDLEEELEDRFGDLPDAVRNLLDVTRMKAYGSRLGIEAISRQNTETVVKLLPTASDEIDHVKLFAISKQHSGQYMKRSNGTLQVVFRTKGLSDRDLCIKLLVFLKDYAKLTDEQEIIPDRATESIAK